MSGGTAVIALLGGSSAFTPMLARHLAAAADALPPLEIRIHGRRADAAAAVARFCGLVAGDRGAPHEYVVASDVSTAARGADVVINQMRVGGWAGRHHDDTFPLRFDLPGDETIGPGGLASAIRSLPVVSAAARAVQSAAPDAWFVNMTNPMSTLLAGLRRVPGLRAFGLCELPRVTLSRALARLGLARDAVRVEYLGVNHQGWFTRIEHDGDDRLPALFDDLEARPDPFFGVSASVMRELGALPLSYLRLYYHRAQEVERARGRSASRGRELARLSADLHAWFASAPTGAIPSALERRDTRWYEDWVSMLIGLLGNAASDELYVSEANGDDVADLPPDAIVEKRAIVTPDGPTHVADGASLGEAAAADPRHASRLAFLRAVIDYEEAAVDAALDPTDDAIVTALTRHPWGIDAHVAARLVPSVRAPVEAASGGDPHVDAV